MSSVEALQALRQKLSQLPNAERVEVDRWFRDKDKNPRGLPHPEFKSMTMEAAELVVVHANRKDQVAYLIDGKGDLVGARVERVRPAKTARQMLSEMPSPKSPLEALAILLTADAAALEDGKISTEELQETWRGIATDLKDLKNKKE